MSDKPLPKPVWWKNTYFAIAAGLFVIGMIGMIMGGQTIRDPGQRPESSLSLIYLGAAVIMFVNGWLSHRLTVQHYIEQTGIDPSASKEKSPLEMPDKEPPAAETLSEN